MSNGYPDKEINAYAELHDTDVVAYFGDIVAEEDHYLAQRCGKRRRRKNVLLLLMTYGGDPNAAYRISRTFQNAYKTVEVKGQKNEASQPKVGAFEVCIDGPCKSAGTIICLAADRLLMTGHAELGPIDVQLRKPDEVGEWTSGLTPMQAVQFLETQSVVLFNRHFKSLRDPSTLGFSTRMASEVSANLTIGLLNPIYSQIDPIRLAEVDRSLKIANEYGERLKTKNVKDGTIEKLLTKYPSHNFVIDKREARTLFEKIESPSDELAPVLDFFRYLARHDAEGNGTYVYYLSDEPPEKKPDTNGEQANETK